MCAGTFVAALTRNHFITHCRYWFDKVNHSAVTAPAWQSLAELHPCDYQASMLKGCVPNITNAELMYSEDRRRHVRSICKGCMAVGAPRHSFRQWQRQITANLLLARTGLFPSFWLASG